MQKEKINIVIIDDSKITGLMLKYMLENMEYNVSLFTLPTKALIYIKRNISQINLIITDIIMPEMNGIELADKIKKIKGDIPLIITTGSLISELEIKEIEKLGIKDVLYKPYSAEKLNEIVKKIISQNYLETL